jgi:magnesium transporter
VVPKPGRALPGYQFFKLVKKRVGWLIILFLGEMLTATAMGYFEDSISKGVVLALFIPLIISSGGNSGSQASTLIIQAMALGRGYRCRLVAGNAPRNTFGLDAGYYLRPNWLFRIYAWTCFRTVYGPHWILVGFTVGCALVGVVLWGSLAGSMLPLIQKMRCRPCYFIRPICGYPG